MRYVESRCKVLENARKAVFCLVRIKRHYKPGKRSGVTMRTTETCLLTLVGLELWKEDEGLEAQFATHKILVQSVKGFE